MGYACYDLLIYGSLTKTTFQVKNATPKTIVALFIVDVFQVLILGIMIQSQLLHGIFVSFSPEPQQISLEPQTFIVLFVLAVTWHITIIIWHAIAGTFELVKGHLIIILVYVVAIIVLYLSKDSDFISKKNIYYIIYDFVFILRFFGVVFSLIYWRAKGFIERAMPP